MSKPPGVSAIATEPARRQALAICLVTIFMTLLDMSIVNLTLPQMQQSLHLTPTDTTLVVSGHALVFGLFLVPAGRLGDMYGRRKLLLVGLWLFALTAVACALAPNAAVMVVSRLLRGAASGLLAPQAMGMIQRMFDGPKRGRIFGYFGAVVGFATALGPLLSGALIELFGADVGWRLAFGVTVPVTAVALAIGYRVLPADAPRNTSHRLDMVGTALLGVAVLGILLPVMQASGRTDPYWWLMAFGAVSAVLFVLWERRLGARGGEPVIELSLLRVRGFTVGVLIATLFFAGFTSIFLVLSMFLQQGLEYSALRAALTMLIFTAGSACAAIVSGRLAYRFGRWIVVIGGAVAAIGVASTAVVAHQVSGPNATLALAVPLLVSGTGCGLLIAANQTLALKQVRHVHGGVAFGVYETCQRIATAVGMAVSTSLFFRGMGATRGGIPGRGRGAAPGKGAVNAVHDNAVDLLPSMHTAVAMGLAAPALLLAAAALIGLIDVLLPVRAEPGPISDRDLETTAFGDLPGR